MKKIILFCLFCLMAWQGMAQIETVKKLEIPIHKKLGDSYALINLKEKGIITVLESDEVLKNMKQEVIFTRYDTALEKQWTRSTALESTQEVFQYHIDENQIWFLIKKPDYEYDILTLNIHNGLIEAVDYEKIMNLDIQIFKPANGLLYLAGTTDEKPTVLRYDPAHKTPSKVLSSINQLKADVKEIVSNPSDSSIYVLLAYPYQTKGLIYVNQYDYFGKLLSNVVISPHKDYRVLTWQPYLWENKELYLFGTYAFKSRGKAQGIYVGRPETARQTFRFYDFSNMKGFYNYLTEKKRDRIKGKIKEKQESNRLFFHDKNLFIRDLKIINNRILMVGEAYQPIYDRSSTSDRMWMAGMYGTYRLNQFYSNRFGNGQFFDSKRKPLYYRYKHANIWAFDLETNLLWDNCLKLEDSEVPYPQALMQFYAENDSLTMMYMTDKEIFTTKVAGEEEVKSVRIFGLEPKDDSGLYTDRENELLRHWYGNYFLLQGIRERKNSPQNESAKVFYIAKMMYLEKLQESEKQ